MYLIPSLGLPGTEICGPAKIQCYREAVEDLNNVAVDGVKDLEADEETPICNCLPSCTYLTYDSEISYGDVSFKGHHRSNTYFASGTKEYMHMFIKCFIDLKIFNVLFSETSPTRILCFSSRKTNLSH